MNEQHIELPTPSPDFDQAEAAALAQKFLTTPVMPAFSDEANRGGTAEPFLAADVITHEHQIIDDLYGQVDSLEREKISDSERRDRREADQHRLAITDELTQLNNRAGLKEAYADLQQTALGRRGTDNGNAILIADLDHFKNINDTYGHPVGDRVLQRTAQKLRDLLREGDIVGRWGGEEFLVILPNTNATVAQIVAERIRKGIDETEPSEEIPVHLTASIGVGPLKLTEELEPNVNSADSALYDAKNGGRNRVNSSYTSAD